jgi:hypothetical protein
MRRAYIALLELSVTTEQQAEIARLAALIAEARTRNDRQAAVTFSAEKSAYIQANGLWKAHGRGSRAGLRQQAERRAMTPWRKPGGMSF